MARARGRGENLFRLLQTDQARLRFCKWITLKGKLIAVLITALEVFTTLAEENRLESTVGAIFQHHGAEHLLL